MPRFQRRRDLRQSADPAAVETGVRGATRADQSSPSTVADAALAGYRLLRRLAAGDRADIYLAVVDGADGGGAPSTGAPLVVMRIYGSEADGDAITTEIEAMEADRTGTLPRLLDVANVADGRGCLIVERVSGRSFSDLLTAGGLSPGQVVTALAPIIVALRGLGDRDFVHTRLAASDVVIDDAGRPRLMGLGALRRLDRLATAADRIAALREGHAAMLRLIEDAAAASTERAAFARVLDPVRAALDARPFRRMESEIERALFTVAPARPIVASVGRPIGDAAFHVPALVRGEARSAEPEVDSRVPAEADPPREARIGGLAALAQLPPSAIDDLAATMDSDPRVRAVRLATDWARRRRPALLAGGLVGAAALVALLTVVPPSSAVDRDARAVEPASGDSASTDPDHPVGATGAGTMEHPESPGGPDVVAPGVPDDPAAAAAALLEIRHTCLAAADLACVLAVDQPGSPIAARDRAAIESGARMAAAESHLDGITVVADLGDAVVLSVPWAEAEREPASLLMMRSEAGWRLREWFD